MTPQEAIYELAEACLVRCAGEPSEDCLDCEINMAMEALDARVEFTFNTFYYVIPRACYVSSF